MEDKHRYELIAKLDAVFNEREKISLPTDNYNKNDQTIKCLSLITSTRCY